MSSRPCCAICSGYICEHTDDDIQEYRNAIARERDSWERGGPACPDCTIYVSCPKHLNRPVHGPTKEELDLSWVQALREVLPKSEGGFAQDSDGVSVGEPIDFESELHAAADVLLEELGAPANELLGATKIRSSSMGEPAPGFDPQPRFYNHMCHWRPWAEHFKTQDGDEQTLALMLGAAVDEIERLCKMGQNKTRAHASLLFAFIDLVETGRPKPFAQEEKPSIGEAFKSIQALNRWRAENKLNITAVDV